jgi:hypothetical protein
MLSLIGMIEAGGKTQIQKDDEKTQKLKSEDGARRGSIDSGDDDGNSKKKKKACAC